MTNFMNTTAVKTLQILNWVFFLAMVFVNFLANYLPINGKNTGQLSNQYPNLFVPAPITFAIWGLIYLLLFIFCVKQSKGVFSSAVDEITAETVQLIGFRFIITCVLNATWIFVWHYEYIGASVVVMLLFLAQLIDINKRLDNITIYLSNASRFAIKAPFGMYMGWICVATVANVTAFLVNTKWERLGQTEVFWTCLMIMIATVIVSYSLIKVRNFYIGLVVIWAFSGIIYARLNAEIYQRFIVWTAVFGIGLVLILTIIEISRAIFRKHETRVVVTTTEIHS
ncbi:MAG: hypothetical protein U5N85_15245 [Arcicella sp.]|nr:hypothetical protein [Arcicella sp.]